MFAGEINLYTWYKPSIDKKILKELSKRSDGKAFKHVIIYFITFKIMNMRDFDMISRRDFLQATVAASAIYGAGGFTRASAQQSLSQNELLKFDTTGNVTLIHITDIHGQLNPV